MFGKPRDKSAADLKPAFTSPTNHRGQTPLMVAVAEGDDLTAQMLIAQGWPLDARDFEGRTALHYAACRNYYSGKIIEALIEAGANPNLTDCMGFTPLHMAVNWSNLSSTTILMSHGVDTTIRSNRGETPMQLSKALQRGSDFTRALTVTPKPAAAPIAPAAPPPPADTAAKAPKPKPLTVAELTDMKDALQAAFLKARAGNDNSAALAQTAEALLKVDARLRAAAKKAPKAN